MNFDLDALRDDASTLALVPIFLVALVVVRAIPAAVYRPLVRVRGALAAGMLQATSLPFIVTATIVGVEIDALTPATAAAFVAAGLVSAWSSRQWRPVPCARNAPRRFGPGRCLRPSRTPRGSRSPGADGTWTATCRSATMVRAPADHSDDPMLVAALCRGDEEAFAWLVDRYDGTLRRLASSFVSSRSVADEVVQETWLAVIEGIDRFEGRSSLKTWIFRILMNVARTRGARENRSLPFWSMAGDASDPSAAEPSFPRERFDRRPGPLHGHWLEPPEPWEQQPAERLVTTEALDRVRQAIVRLPAQQQTVITLRDIEA